MPATAIIVALCTSGATVLAAGVAAITACSLKYIPYVMEERDEGRKLDSSQKKLEKAACNLQNKKTDLECQINSTNKKRTRQWEVWCDKVDDILGDWSILADKYDAKKRRYTMCAFHSHARLSKKMEKLTNDIVYWEKEMNIGEALMDGETNSRVTVRPETEEKLPWLSENARNLMNKLTGENAMQKLGIYGEEGIGKTTVMRCLEETAKNSSLFQSVIFVSFEADDSEERIGQSILKQLEFTPNNSSKAPEKMYLLLLDQVTREIKLEKLGISEDQINWKVVVAVRNKPLFDGMGVEHVVQIETLPKDEAAKLFLQITDGKYHNLATHIVEKHCGGRPQLIKTLATLLKGNVDWPQINKDLVESEEALQKSLENYGDDWHYVFRVIYEKLNDCEKSCFAYGAFYPPDQEIYKNHLIECWLAEQYIPNRKTPVIMRCLRNTFGCNDKQMFRKACKQGHIVIKHLLDICLLEKGTKVNCVTMPWMFRKWVLKTETRIGFGDGSEQNRVVTSTNIRTLNEDSFKTASTLFLRRCVDEELTNILEPKFVLMRHLRVFDLSYTCIKQLPPSIVKLTNLTALYLNNCCKLTELPSEIRELKNLKILDTCRSQIPTLPREIRGLKGLRCLRVSFQNVHQNQSESTDIIAKLSLLEEMTILFEEAWQIQWDGTLNVIMEELARLKGFTSLCFYFPSSYCLEDFLCRTVVWNNKDTQRGEQTFKFFRLIVGSFDKRHEIDMPEYKVAPRLKNFEESPNQKGASIGISKVLKQGLELISHNTIQHLSSIGTDSMAELKVCVIKDCKEMKSVICCKDAKKLKQMKSATEDKDTDASILPLLKQLHLMDLENLTCLFECSMGMGRLGYLTTLTVARCKKLKVVLSIDMTMQIPCLKRLRVDSCKAVNVIIESRKFGRIAKMNLLSNMESIELIKLPACKSICQNILLVCPSLQTIEVDQCPSLENLSLSELNARKPFLRCKKDWWCNLEAEVKNRFQSQAHVYINESNQPATDGMLNNNILKQKLAEQEESQHRRNQKGTPNTSQTTSKEVDNILAEDASLSKQVKNEEVGKVFKGLMSQEGSKMRLSMELDMSPIMAEVSSIKEVILWALKDLQHEMKAGRMSTSKQELSDGINDSTLQSKMAASEIDDTKPPSTLPSENNEQKSINSMSPANKDDKSPRNGDYQANPSVNWNPRQIPPHLPQAPKGNKVYTCYRKLDIKGDGRCLFRSIARGERLRNGETVTSESEERKMADDLRARVADELKRRKDEQPWFLSIEEDTTDDFETYVEYIKKPCTWGGYRELIMATHVLELPISVFVSNEDASGVISIYEYGEEYGEENPISLLFNGSDHYSLLIKIADNNI